MKYAKSTNNKTALLAILAVFAMVAAGAAVVMASSDVQAEVPTSTATEAGETILATATQDADGDKKYLIDLPTLNANATFDAKAHSVVLYIIPDGTHTVTVKDTLTTAEKTVTICVAKAGTTAGTNVTEYYSDLKVILDNSAAATDSVVITPAFSSTNGPSIVGATMVGFAVKNTTVGNYWTKGTTNFAGYAKGATFSLDAAALAYTVKLQQGTATVESSGAATAAAGVKVTTAGLQAAPFTIAVTAETGAIGVSGGDADVNNTVAATKGFVTLANGSGFKGDAFITGITKAAIAYNEGHLNAEVVLYSSVAALPAEVIGEVARTLFAYGETAGGTYEAMSYHENAITLTLKGATFKSALIMKSQNANPIVENTKVTSAAIKAYGCTGTILLTYGADFAWKTGALTSGTLELVNGTFTTSAAIADMSGIDALGAGKLLVIGDEATFTAAHNLTITGLGLYISPEATVDFGNHIVMDGIAARVALIGDDEDGATLKGEYIDNQNISKSFYLTGDTIIAAGTTFNVASGGSIALNGHNLIVKGTLNVASGGYVEGLVTSEGASQIQISTTGDITGNGAVGAGVFPVVIASDDAKYGGTASLLNVTGVEFEFVRAGTSSMYSALLTNGGAYTYNMIVGGSVSKYTGAGAGNSKGLALSQYTMVGDLEIAAGVTLIGNTSTVISKNATLTVNGTVEGTMYLDQGAIVNVSAGTVTLADPLTLKAYTGKFISNTAAEALATALDTTTFTISNSKGFVLTLDKVTTTEATGTYYDLRLDLSGSLDKVGTAAIAADMIDVARVEGLGGEKITPFSGFYISGDLEFKVGKTATFYPIDASADGVKIVVSGTAHGKADAIKFTAANVSFSYYEIKASASNDVFYWTSFDNAVAQLGSSETGVVVYGEVSITGELEITASKTLDITNAAFVDVKSTGVLSFGSEATLNGAVRTVTGLMYVADGASVKKPVNYDVMAKDSENNVTYCGIQVALDAAEPGSVLTLNPALESIGALTADLTIPEGITLNAGGVKIIAGNYDAETNKKTLTVNGILISEGEVEVYNLKVAGIATFSGTVKVKNDIVVSGTCDLSDGSLAQQPKKITSTGAFVVVNNTNIPDTVSAAVTTDDEGNLVYTTVSGAFLLSLVNDGDITVYGTIKESSTDVAVLEGITLTIAEGATVELGTIALDEGKLVNNGTLSATVVAPSGTVGSTVDAAIMLSTVAGTGFQVNSVAKSQTDASIKMFVEVQGDITAGAIVFANGAFDTSAALRIGIGAGFDGSMTVASGAAITVASGKDLTAFNSQVISGKIDAKGNVTLNGKQYIYGTIDIAANKTLVLGEAEVDGTITQKDNTSDLQATKLTVGGDITIKNTTAMGTLIVEGKVTISDPNAVIATGLTVTGELVVGENCVLTVPAATIGAKPTSLGATNGAVSGKLRLAGDAATSFFKVYVGANVADAIFQDNAGSAAVAIIFDINDSIYAIGFAKNGGTATPWDVIGAEVITIPGISANPTWAIDGVALSNTNKGVFAEGVTVDGAAATSVVPVKISVATGMSIWVDGVRYSTGDLEAFTVGTHTVAVTVNPGYKYADGTTATITFDGKAITGLLVFTISPSMVGGDAVVLSAIGDIVVDQPEPTPQEKEDNTIIMVLLAVLVVMVVILAIVTVLRMMRS